ncbi:MAG: hypothetical protein WKH64_19315 [Chloroflexia bacterium]
MNDRRASIGLRSGYWWGSAATASLIPYLVRTIETSVSRASA